MANDEAADQVRVLGARLAALRARHPTLAVLTELVEQDGRGAIVRATLLIDGEARARGHAAQRADPAGAGVAVAERLAVAQALLLGGFADPADAAPATSRPGAPSRRRGRVLLGRAVMGRIGAPLARNRQRIPGNCSWERQKAS